MPKLCFRGIHTVQLPTSAFPAGQQFCLTAARIALTESGSPRPQTISSGRWSAGPSPAGHDTVDGCAIYNEPMDANATSGGRVMALDVGSKRIGVAVTDPLDITAQGLDTIQRQNKRRDLEALGQVLAKYGVREIVVGLPLRLSGAEGTQSEKMRRFADDLHKHFGLTVHLWDERWTSTEANRLLRETDLSIKKRGQAVDRMAAILILQSWMEAHPNRPRSRQGLPRLCVQHFARCGKTRHAASLQGICLVRARRPVPQFPGSADCIWSALW